MSQKAKIAVALFIALFVLLPSLVLVASANSNQPNEAIWNPSILKGPLVTCVGMPTGGSGSLPICSNLCDLVSTVTNVVYYVMGFLLWIILPIMVAWGGVRILTAGGNPGAVSNGRKIITGTVIGLLIVLGAYLIILTFVNVMGISGIGGFTSNGACVVSPLSGSASSGTGNGGSKTGGGTVNGGGGNGAGGGNASGQQSAACGNSTDCSGSLGCYSADGFTGCTCQPSGYNGVECTGNSITGNLAIQGASCALSSQCNGSLGCYSADGTPPCSCQPASYNGVECLGIAGGNLGTQGGSCDNSAQCGGALGCYSTDGNPPCTCQLSSYNGVECGTASSPSQQGNNGPSTNNPPSLNPPSQNPITTPPSQQGNNPPSQNPITNPASPQGSPS